MPTWGGILKKLNQMQATGVVPDIDGIRREYLLKTHQHTKRNVILYATRFTQPALQAPPDLLSITDSDIQGLMEVIHGLKGTTLDLILHSPGGSLEATESFVHYLRSKFKDIRVIVPHLAMSAATMVCCAADSIMMGKHSFLGPIDPQMIVQTPLGPRMVPAQAILAQFEMAKKECANAASLGAWLPMLGQYGPDLLVQCENASERSEQLVRTWLKEFMFKNDASREEKADAVASWLAKHDNFKSHGCHIPRKELEGKGLVVSRLEDDQVLQDLFLSVFHATMHTFAGTPAAKVIENHLGAAYIQFPPLVAQVQTQPQPHPQSAPEAASPSS